MNYKLVASLFILLFTNININTHAEFSASIESGMCKPYFASIKAKEANLHVGPGKEYKVIYKYITKTIPVLITAKYDHWRKIQDIDGDSGWMHKSLLSKDRYIMIKDNITELFESYSADSKQIASIKKNKIVKFIAVNGDWCNVKFYYRGNSYTGWVSKKSIFGMFENEK